MTYISDQDRDAFRQGYAVSCAWANTYTYIDDELEQVLDAVAELGSDGLWHITAGSVPGADYVLDMADADGYMDVAADLLRATGEADWSLHGHDFALTRNRHGAGFWDRGYGAVGDTLTDMAGDFGELDILI